MIVVCKYLVPKGYHGITLFPFIILASAECKRDRVLLNHERIHLRQQLELLLVLFYIWYAVEFMRHYLRTKCVREAYHLNIFEREAYAHEQDLDYLKHRKLYSFIRD